MRATHFSAADFVAKLLRRARGAKSLEEMTQELGLSNRSCLHHWETGARKVPLATLLHAIDIGTGRLQFVLDVFGIEIRPRMRELQGLRTQERFFAQPWTPTVYLFLQVDRYRAWGVHSSARVARALGINSEEVDQSLRDLLDIGMIHTDGKKYAAVKGQHYLSPFLTSEVLQRLNRYWYSRSFQLTEYEGFHKIEEHALSHKSFEKIKGWVNELRERIRNEVKQSEPETLCHIHWQLALVEGS